MMAKKKRVMVTSCSTCKIMATCYWDGVLGEWLCDDCLKSERAKIRGANRMARRRDR